jgi:CSLREA domain-containing protein
MNASATGTEAGAAIVVTTTADELVDDGNCSLREAIQAVNTQIAVDACGDGGFETIELPSGVYTLTLAGPNEDDIATGDLDIKRSVTIQGRGQAYPWSRGINSTGCFKYTQALPLR